MVCKIVLHKTRQAMIAFMAGGFVITGFLKKKKEVEVSVGLLSGK